MLRLFISLLAMLLLAILGYWFGVSGFSKYMYTSISEDIRMKEITGFTALLDAQVMGLSKEQCDDKLEELKSIFRYEIDLILLDEISDNTLSNKDKQILINKGLVVTREGSFDIGALYYFPSKKIHNYIWKLQVTPPFLQVEETFLEGPLTLITQQLSNKPKEQWQQEIERVASTFKTPMHLLTLTEAKSARQVKEGQLTRLKAGKSILVYDEKAYLKYIFRRINQSDYVIKIGSIEYPPLLKRIQKNISLIAFFIMVSLIASAVWLWLRPVWRDLNHLNKASQQFGKGQLNTRVKQPKYSLIGSSLQSFNEMADQVEQLVASHKMLTNAVSHELRTPISSLQFGIDMLEKTKNNKDKARYVASINTDIEELDEMLGELLTYARLDRQVIELNKEPIIPSKWLEQQIQYWKKHCKQIEIKSNHTGLSSKKVSCMDEKLMTRALHNLIQNACRYAKHEIHINFQHKNDHYMISVEDDGLGIPKEYQDSIFEPFTRVDDSRDRDSGGYGLGLAIVGQIAQAHQGEVSLHSSMLGGAKFIIEWNV